MRRFTQGYLKSILDYNEETGDFRWVRDQIHAKAGDLAGYHGSSMKYTLKSDKASERLGRRLIMIEGSIYPAARLAWLYVTGEWSFGLVKCLDGEGVHFSNLQVMGDETNLRTKLKPMPSGQRGVRWVRALKKWEVVKEGKRVKLYNYSELEDAITHRKEIIAAETI